MWPEAHHHGAPTRKRDTRFTEIFHFYDFKGRRCVAARPGYWNLHTAHAVIALNIKRYFKLRRKFSFFQIEVPENGQDGRDLESHVHVLAKWLVALQ